jgi:hypothetical protein
MDIDAVMNEEYFRYFIGNYDGLVYRITVDKKNNLYKGSEASYYKDGDWWFVKGLKISRRKEHNAIYGMTHYYEALKIVKNTEGEYTEGTWEDIVLELL